MLSDRSDEPIGLGRKKQHFRLGETGYSYLADALVSLVGMQRSASCLNAWTRRVTCFLAPRITRCVTFTPGRLAVSRWRRWWVSDEPRAMADTASQLVCNAVNYQSESRGRITSQLPQRGAGHWRARTHDGQWAASVAGICACDDQAGRLNNEIWHQSSWPPFEKIGVWHDRFCFHRRNNPQRVIS